MILIIGCALSIEDGTIYEDFVILEFNFFFFHFTCLASEKVASQWYIGYSQHPFRSPGINCVCALLISVACKQRLTTKTTSNDKQSVFLNLQPAISQAASLVAEGVEEAAAISAAAARLEGKWKEMEKEGKSRKGELERAIVEARDYDGKVSLHFFGNRFFFSRTHM